MAPRDREVSTSGVGAVSGREGGRISKWVAGTWGFITPAAEGEDLFFHRSSIVSRGLDGGRSIPAEGAPCSFVRGVAPDGRAAAQAVRMERERSTT